MTWWILAAIIALSLCGAACFSGTETGLYCLNRLRLHLGVQQKDPRCLRLARWLENEQSALSVSLAGTNVMHYVLTTAVAYALTTLIPHHPADVEFYTVLLVTPMVFVFGEVVPKNIFQRHADALMPRFSLFLTIAERCFRVVGLVPLMTVLTRAANRIFGATEAYQRSAPPKRRVVMLLQEALAGKEHGEHQSGLIDRVVELSETPVRAVMVPFHRIASIPARADRRELIRVGRTIPYARWPVYSGQRSNIVGLVKVDELLRADDWHTVGERMHPMTRLRGNTTAAAAIAGMRRAGSEMAAVVDPAGRMLGIVTLRDLLEEVVGEFGNG